MNEITEWHDSEDALTEKSQYDLVQITKEILSVEELKAYKENAISMPIAELSSLGTAVSSLLPAFRTVTETTSVDMQNLYRVVNAAPGDVLKKGKNNIYWGSLKTADGTSKMARFVEAEPLTVSSEAVTAINPATVMMAVALFSIEQKLGDIAETQKQILQNMEFEKESKIEGDVEQLMSIITKYKYNWDNDKFVASNHKMVNDIQRVSRANIISYQKEVNAILADKKFIVIQAQVKAKFNDLLKKFKYYRLSIYTFALSSFLEILLSGNFAEEYVQDIKQEIEKIADTYRDTFEKCSIHLEKMSISSVETNMLKGIGTMGQFTGKIIGSIPIVEKGSVDEFLQDNGDKIKNSAMGIEQNIVRSFAAIRNPGTGVFTEKMSEMIQIYNHTAKICFDSEKIYLVGES